MKYLGKINFQGDVGFIKVDRLPDGLVEAKAQEGKFILGHSETGHHHIVMDRPTVRMFNDQMDLFRSFLVVEGDEPVQLEHLRSFDTHAPHIIEPGIYEFRRGKEYAPEGWRRVAD